MKEKLFKFLKIILPLLLGAFLFWYSLSAVSAKDRLQTWHAITNVDIQWVIFSVVLGLVSHLSRAYRWNFLLEPLGYSVRMTNSFMAVMVGYFANLGIPRSGEFIRAGIASTYDNVPLKKSIGTVISERMVDLLALLLVIGLTILSQSEYVFGFLKQGISNSLLTLGMIILGLGLGVFAIRLLKNSNQSMIVAIRNFGEGIIEGIQSLYYIKQRKAFLFHTILIWSLYVSMFYVIKFALPDTQQLSIGAILVTFVAGSFAMSLTNGGVGAFPIAVSYALGLFDIQESSGLAFGWILWGSQTAINCILGVLSFLVLPLLNNAAPQKVRFKNS